MHPLLGFTKSLVSMTRIDPMRISICWAAYPGLPRAKRQRSSYRHWVKAEPASDAAPTPVSPKRIIRDDYAPEAFTPFLCL